MKGIPLLARVDGKLMELNKKFPEGKEIQYLTIEDKAGYLTYQRSVILLLLKAIHHVGGFKRVDETFIHYSVGPGIFVTIDDGEKITEGFLADVKKTMQDLVKKDLKIEKSNITTDDAIALFGQLGMQDKEKLFHYRRSSRVNIYTLAGFKDYFYGYMVPSTGCLKLFELYPYEGGFVLQLPTMEKPCELQPFDPDAKLFQIQKESLNWGSMLKVRNVGDLNELIVKGQLQDLILVQEALQEKKISEIADRIAKDPSKKLIMIAGPSSLRKDIIFPQVVGSAAKLRIKAASHPNG